MRKRPRTYWIVRQRYLRLAWAAAAIGGLVALIVFVAMGRSLWQAEHHLPTTFILAGIVTVVAAVILPRWGVLAIWNHQYRTHRQRWE